ncbi:MAG: Hsp70 protein [Edafosvirus sp.]|uniref:Hsp70 protein n=1 Tax=Edafosvirus sp. TaxID=2487765 RepID=A0A3G4ZZC7_9VIRU|nr:MAG: Hsp70 protein [Edafosvirus sp.]
MNDKQVLEDEIIIGIDLGTVNSCVGVWRNNNLEIIPDEKGNRTIPSIVSFTNRTKYVGYEAKNQTEINPKNTFYEIKRLIGRKMNDESVINDKQYITYDLEEDHNGNVLVISEVNNIRKRYTPEEISSIILIRLKEMACNYLKKEITKAVITVPAYFNDSQRQATVDAAKIAGLDCIRIINEPTSAALAYGLQTQSKKEGKDTELTIIVYDLGGGTLDVSLLTINDGVFEVQASVGNTHLGGTDFDNRLLSYCLSEFKKKNNIGELNNISPLSLQKLKGSCENAKKILSTITKTHIGVKEFYNNGTVFIDLFITITRDKFIELCKDLLILCVKPLEDVLNSCNLQKDDIDEVILVGGMTRMPAIRENIQKFIGKEPNFSVNPDEVVAAGASIQGYILSHISDPFSEKIQLVDIIPLSLGVETIGGVMNVLIRRNSTIPITKKRKYTTDSDYETYVTIKIFQGEREMTKDNILIGEFKLSGLEPAPRGIAQIEVTFDINTNGIIKITAEDLKNIGNKNEILITDNQNRLTHEQIKKLIDEAQECQLNDKIEREKKQSYYEIDDLCSNILSNVNNEEFKLKDDDKKFILDDITKIQKWLLEKKYFERNKDDYKTVSDRLKKKYGTLILKTVNTNSNVKASDQNGENNNTNIYNNEEDEINVFEKIENEEYGQADEIEKNELKQLKTVLLDLCYNIFDLLGSPSLKLDKIHKNELKDFIDDVLLWIHIQQKINKSEYKMKIDEVNNICNKILEDYEKNQTKIFDEDDIDIKTSRGTLEQLCYTIKSSIVSNMFSLQESKIKLLEAKIDEVLDWLIEIDSKKYEDVKLNKNTNDNCNLDELYKEKIDEINKLCDHLYNSIMNINVKKNIDVLDDTYDENDGTNIADLMEKKIVSSFSN